MRRIATIAVSTAALVGLVATPANAAPRDVKAILQNFKQFQEMLSNAMTLGNMFTNQAIQEEKELQASAGKVVSGL
ncbi:hypothetical protein [Streptomyces sp. NPDC049585]|uniref:hypothetical protein n=1 Tax=Streptomyces sp. NPDC049585 TaxID=3155154 RepID=UPI0034421D4C